jgi:hypothetical protein
VGQKLRRLDIVSFPFPFKNFLYGIFHSLKKPPLPKPLGKEFWKGIGEREGERRKKGIGGIGEGLRPLI